MDDVRTIKGHASAYVLDGTMGRGSKFGGVMTGTDADSRQVTVKALERYWDGLSGLLGRLSAIERRDIARVIETFVGEDGRLYVVREKVEGTDLKTIFADKKIYGKIDEDQFVKMGCSVLKALEAIHGAGIIHRDIKPSNIVLRHEKGADITKADFGDIALIDFEQSQPFPATGTPRTQFALIYSPPEMLLKHNELTGPSSDLFALSTTIYHLVMGKTPYTDCNPEVLINLQLTYPMKKPGRMTEELFDVLSRAAYKASFRLPPRKLTPEEVTATLRKGIEGRYQSANEMLQDLEKVPHALRPANWWQRTFGD